MYTYNWCQTCPSCVPRETAPVRGKAPLQNLQAGYPMQTQLEKQKQIYDHKVYGSPLEPNTLVWLHFTVIPRGGSKKLHYPWTGPW